MEHFPTVSLGLSEESAPNEQSIRALKQGMDDYNFAAAGPDNHQSLWLFARDEANRVQGGLYAQTSWCWLFVDWLWVAQVYRGHKIGLRLLRGAENVASKRGCVGAFVNTYTFQAPGFYRRNGYTEFGRIDGFPPGHSRIWFSKALRAKAETV